MLTHIYSLEDTALVLSENKEESKKKEYREAKKLAKTIKRKRQIQAKETDRDSDNSEDNANYALPRFQKRRGTATLKELSKRKEIEVNEIENNQIDAKWPTRKNE